jgi:hypothetical protein
MQRFIPILHLSKEVIWEAMFISTDITAIIPKLLQNRDMLIYYTKKSIQSYGSQLSKQRHLLNVKFTFSTPIR